MSEFNIKNCCKIIFFGLLLQRKFFTIFFSILRILQIKMCKFLLISIKFEKIRAQKFCFSFQSIIIIISTSKLFCSTHRLLRSWELLIRMNSNDSGISSFPHITIKSQEQSGCSTDWNHSLLISVTPVLKERISGMLFFPVKNLITVKWKT